MKVIFLEVKKSGSFWKKDGEYHRENKHPAIIFESGHKEWWCDGIMLQITDIKNPPILPVHDSLDKIKSVEKFLDNA